MLPPADLLSCSAGAGFHHYDSAPLLEALATLGATSNVADVITAPQAVRVEVEPCDKIRMRAFRGIEADLMQMLSIPAVRIEAPTPGKTTVGVELPRAERATIYLGDVVNRSQAPLRAAVGVGLDGSPVVLDLASYPHLLVAGRSGGGKSSVLHALLCSLLSVCTPADLELILVDTKMTELSIYEGLPHCSNVVYNPDRAIDVLWGMVDSMRTTYRCMRDYGARTLDELNTALRARGKDPIPRRVLVCDELADLMMTGRGKVESAVVSLGQLGRAAGFHLVLATQSPRVQVCTGLIKANLVARMALSTSSALDSRVILDINGAEDLLGRGDFLLDDGQSGKLVRGQAAWCPTEDVEAMVSWWKAQDRSAVAA